MATSIRGTTILILLVLGTAVRETHQEESCWDDIPVAEAKRNTCTECPDDSKQTAQSFYKREMKKIQYRLAMNCMAAELTTAGGWTGSTDTYAWLDPKVADGNAECAKWLEDYTWGNLADKAAKEAKLTEVNTEYETVRTEAQVLGQCFKDKCSGEFEAKTTEDLLAKATLLTSALKCATDVSLGGISIPGFSFHKCIAVPFLNTDCTAVKEKFPGTNITTKEFVEEDSKNLDRVLDTVYRVAYCRRDGLCPGGDTEYLNTINKELKSVKCTSDATPNVAATKRMNQLDRVLAKNDFKYTATCPSGSQNPSADMNAIGRATSKLQPLLKDFAKLRNECKYRKQSDELEAGHVANVVSFSTQATCLHKVMSDDKAPVASDMEAIQNITTKLGLQISDAECPSTVDPDAGNKIPKLRKNIEGENVHLATVTKCPSDEVKEKAIGWISNSAVAVLKKGRCYAGSLDDQNNADFKTEIDKLERLAKKYYIMDDGRGIECDLDINDTVRVERVKELYQKAEELGQSYDFLISCSCRMKGTVVRTDIFKKMKVAAKVAVCNYKDITGSKDPAQADYAIVTEIVSNTRFIQVNENECPAASGQDEERIATISKAATQLTSYNTLFDIVTDCECKMKGSCKCKKSLAEEVLQRYDEVSKLAHDAHCIEPNEAAAENNVKEAIAQIKALYAKYLINLNTDCTGRTESSNKLDDLNAVKEKLTKVSGDLDFLNSNAASGEAKMYELSYTMKLKKEELNCLAAAAKLLTEAWSGTVKEYPWLGGQGTNCDLWKSKNEWETTLNTDALKKERITLRHEEYKTLARNFELLMKCKDSSCSSGEAIVETRKVTEMEEEAAKLESALQCAQTEGVTPPGYTYTPRFPITMPCAAVNSLYPGVTKDNAFVLATSDQLTVLLKELHEVFYCREDGACNIGDKETVTTISNAISDVKCTDAAATTTGSDVRMEALDTIIAQYGFVFAEQCPAAKSNPSDKPNLINKAIKQVQRYLPKWKHTEELCECRKALNDGKTDIKTLATTLIGDAECLNEKLSDKTGAQGNMTKIGEWKSAFSVQTAPVSDCADNADSDEIKNGQIVLITKRLGEMQQNYVSLGSCPCESKVKGSVGIMNDILKKLAREAECLKRDLDDPASADFKQQKDVIDELAMKYNIKVDDVSCVSNSSASDADLIAKATEMKTKMQVFATKLGEYDMCPCKTEKAINDVELFEKIKRLAEKAKCVANGVATAAAKMTEIETLANKLAIKLKTQGCPAASGTDAERTQEVEKLAARVKVHNDQFDWVQNCPCDMKDGQDREICKSKSECTHKAIHKYWEMKKLADRAKCVYGTSTNAEATTQLGKITQIAADYFIQVVESCTDAQWTSADDAKRLGELTKILNEVNEVKSKLETFEECTTSMGSAADQFYEVRLKKTLLKTSLNCMAKALKSEGWTGTVLDYPWLCDELASDTICPPWLTKENWATLADKAAKETRLGEVDTEYKNTVKKLKLLDQLAEDKCMSGIHYLEEKSYETLTAEAQKLTSALKCAKDAGTAVPAGFTFTQATAVPILLTDCEAVKTQFPSADIMTTAFMTDADTKLQIILKKIYEVAFCRHDVDCPCGDTEAEAIVLGMYKGVRCTEEAEDSPSSNDAIAELVDMLVDEGITSLPSCDGKKPTKDLEAIHKVSKMAKTAIKYWKFEKKLCPCRNKLNKDIAAAKGMLTSHALYATCLFISMTNKADTADQLTEINTLTGSLGISVDTNGCNALNEYVTGEDSAKATKINGISEKIKFFQNQTKTFMHCPCNELAGTVKMDILNILERMGAKADCLERDLDDKTAQAFKTEKDEINRLVEQYNVMVEGHGCVPDLASTDVELAAEAAALKTKMAELAGKLDGLKPCRCRINVAKLSSFANAKINDLAKLAKCHKNGLTDQDADAKMTAISQITNALFLTPTTANCDASIASKSDADKVQAISNSAARINVHYEQLGSVGSCSCQEIKKNQNDCKCKVEKAEKAVNGLEEIADLSNEAHCVQPASPSADIQTKQDEITSFAAKYFITYSQQCKAENTGPEPQKLRQLDKIKRDITKLDNRISKEEKCPCKSEIVSRIQASKQKLAEAFHKAKCFGENFKEDETVKSALKEIDVIIGAQAVTYTTDCTGFATPASQSTEAALKITEQRRVIDAEVQKLDYIDQCRGITNIACRAGTRPKMYNLTSDNVDTITSPDEDCVTCMGEFYFPSAMEVTYETTSLAIEPSADGSCTDSKLIVKDGDNTTVHCTGKGVDSTTSTKGSLMVTFMDKCGDGKTNSFVMKIEKSYRGCNGRPYEIEIDSLVVQNIKPPLDDSGNYLANLNCSWIVRRNSSIYKLKYNSAAALDIKSADTTACAEDYLTIQDGVSAEPSKKCGTDAVAEAEATSDTLTVGFVSNGDADTGTGVEMVLTPSYNLPTACDPANADGDTIDVQARGTYYATTFNPKGVYLPDQVCKYKYTYNPQKFKVSYKTIGDFDIKNGASNCADDKLEIVDAASKPADMASHCISAAVANPVNVTSGTLFVEFASNPDDQVGTGAVVEVTFEYNLPEGCTGTCITQEINSETHVTIKSWGKTEGFNYVEGMVCCWNFTNANSQAWTIGYQATEAINITTSSAETCNEDYLEFSDDNGTTTKKCGETTIPLTKVEGSAYVKFVSDSDKATTGTGFTFEVQGYKRELPDGCQYGANPGAEPLPILMNSTDRGRSILSTDRLKGLKYIPDVQCKYLVTCDNDIDLFIYTNGTVDINSGGDCSTDYLKIKEGVSGEEECITSSISKRHLNECHLEVTFFSNPDADVGDGFELVLEPTPKGCGKAGGHEFSEPGSKQLSFYTDKTKPYLPNMSCDWGYKWNPEIMEGSYSVSRVDIKGSPAGTCSTGDKLALDNSNAESKVCGSDDVVETTVNTGQLNLTFTSDGDANVGSGFLFNLTVEYKACKQKSSKSLMVPEKDIVTFYGTDGDGYGENKNCQWEWLFDSDTMKVDYKLPILSVTGELGSCGGDKVAITDGSTSNEYCGSAAVGDEQVQSGNLSAVFTSDETKDATGKGFTMEVNAKYKACEAELVKQINCANQSVEFYQAKDYEKDMECKWKFTWDKQVCDIEYSFTQIDVNSATAECTTEASDDFVQSYDGAEEAIPAATPKKCGQTPVQPVNGTSGTLKLKFKSNSDDNVGKGFIFNVTATEREKPEECKAQGKTIQITSPGDFNITSFDRGLGLNYVNGLNCSWTVTWNPRSWKIEYKTEGDVEIKSDNDQCEKDVLTIQDGAAEPAKHCRETKIGEAAAVAATSGNLVFTFTSDGTEVGKGFKLVLTAKLPDACTGSCEQIPLACNESRTISSWAPTSGAQYIPNLSCCSNLTWDKQYCNVAYRSLSMDIEQTTNCEKDYLSIKEGDSDVIKKCGTAAIAEKRVNQTIDRLELRFVTDENTATLGTGFQLQFTPSQRELPEGCTWGDGTGLEPKTFAISGPNEEHTISSVDYETSYPNNITCKWKFTWNDEIYEVIYDFINEMDIEEGGDDCPNDYVSFQYGNASAEKKCGTKQSDPDLTASSNEAQSDELTVVFSSNAETTKKGFNLKVKSRPSAACDPTREKIIDCKDGVDRMIKSPGFTSGQYPPNLNCSWKMNCEPSDGKSFELQFEEFDLQESDACSLDSVEFVQGGKELIKLCGKYDYTKEKEEEDGEKNKDGPGKGKAIGKDKDREDKSKGRGKRNAFRWRRETQGAASHGHPFEYRFKSGPMEMKFITDPTTAGKGFRVRLKSRQATGPCDGVPKTIEMDKNNKIVKMKSQFYDTAGKYPADAQCSWKIQYNKDKFRIQCGFADKFELDGTADANCPNDRVEIKDGSNDPVKFCTTNTFGSDVNALESPTYYESGEFNVSFTSGSGDTRGKGFQLVCHLHGAIPAGCKEGRPEVIEVPGADYIWTSPGYDADIKYPHDLNCSFIFVAPERKIEVYGCGEQDLEGTDGSCEQDYVSFSEERKGEEASQGQRTVLKCGTKAYSSEGDIRKGDINPNKCKKREQLLFSGEYNGNVSTTFVTNSANNGKGFMYVIKRANCAADCLGYCGTPRSTRLCPDLEICTGGKTGKTRDDPSFAGVLDCRGGCDNNFVNDSCGNCVQKTKTSIYTDCNGDCWSVPEFEKEKARMVCDVCILGKTGKNESEVKDLCGECKSKSKPCNKCTKEDGSIAEVDGCGICGGAGDTCGMKLERVTPELVPSDTDTLIQVNGAGFKTVSKVILKKGGEKTEVDAELNNNQELTATVNLKPGDYEMFAKTASGESEAKLPLKVYDKSSVKVTAVSPEMAELKKEQFKYSFSLTTADIMNSGDQLVCAVQGLYKGRKWGKREKKDKKEKKSKKGEKGKGKGQKKKVERDDYFDYFPAVFVSPTSVTCEFDKQIKSSRKLNISLSVNGGVTLLDETKEVTIQSPAPCVSEARFMNRVNKIMITFTDRTQSVKAISDFVDNPEIFGIGARLVRKSTKRWVIKTGDGATVTEGMTINLKAGSIKAHAQDLSAACTTLNVPVLPPTNARSPVPIIAGAFVGANCDKFVFNLKKSRGAGGRPWTTVVFELLDASGQTMSNAAYDQAKGELTFDGSAVTPCTGCEVQLTLYNFVGSTQSVKRALTIKNSPVPLLDVSCDKEIGGIKISSGVTCTAAAELPGGDCSSEGNVEYTWECPTNAALVTEKNRNSRTMYFEPFSLDSGVSTTCKVTVKMTGSADTVEKEIALTTVAQDLTAIITGVTEKLGHDADALELSGTQSVDPDNVVAAAMQYSWLCETGSGGACVMNNNNVLQLGSEPTTALDPKQLQAGKYKITLEVYKVFRGNKRQAQHSAIIDIVEGSPPMVLMRPVDGKVDPKIGIELTAAVLIVKTSEPLEKSMIDVKSLDENPFDGEERAVTELPEPVFSLLKEENNKNKYIVSLTFEKDTLSPGNKYLIQITVTVGDDSTSGLVEFETKSEVTGCKLNTPSSFSESDEIEMDVVQCVGNDPLKYEFLVRRPDGDTSLAVPSDVSFIKGLTGPEGDDQGKVTFVAKVCDKDDNCNLFVKPDVTVSPVAETEEKMNSLQAFALQQFLLIMKKGAPLDGFIMVCRVNIYIGKIRRKLRKGRGRRAIAATAPAEAKALEAVGQVLGGVVDKTTVNTACQQLSSIDVEQMTAADQATFAGQVESLSDHGKSVGVEKTAAVTLVKMGEGLLEKKLITAEIRNKICQNAYTGLIKSGSVVNQKVEMSADKSSVTLSETNFQSDFEAGESGRPMKVAFPAEVKSKYSEWECEPPKKCYNLALAGTQYKSDYSGTLSADDEKKRSTDIIDISALNPKTGAAVEVKDLKEEIAIKIPVKSGVTCKKHICKWEDGGAWKTDGVKFGGCEGSHVVCKSTHLSTFVAIEDPTPDPVTTPEGGKGPGSDGYDRDNTGAIIGGVVGGILAALLVGMFIFFICRIQQRDVIKVDHIEMGRPTYTEYTYENKQFLRDHDDDEPEKHDVRM